MDPIVIAASVISILNPFLSKCGDKVAEKAGENLWNWLTNTFRKRTKHQQLPSLPDEDFLNKLNSFLIEQTSLDTNLKTAIEKELNTKNIQQIIGNNGDIEKQINIQTNNGNIQM